MLYRFKFDVDITDPTATIQAAIFAEVDEEFYIITKAEMHDNIVDVRYHNKITYPSKLLMCSQHTELRFQTYEPILIYTSGFKPSLTLNSRVFFTPGSPVLQKLTDPNHAADISRLTTTMVELTHPS